MGKDKKWQKVGGGDFPPAFKFTQEGQQVEGIFCNMRKVESDSFESGEAIFIEMDITRASHGGHPGKVSLIGHGLLVHLLKEAEVKEGEEIRITFGGKHEFKVGKKKRKGMKYTLEVCR